MRARSSAVAVLAALALAPTPASGWFTEGHRRVTEDAVRLLSADLPAAFRSGAAAIGAAAVDPDLWKTRPVPALDDREAPEHYFNWELLDRAIPPGRRSEAAAEIVRRGLDPRRVGALPYAVVEGAERLALCFAELRLRPEDETIVWKCRLAAGWLAHYAGDLTQPLHTSIHHDGWAAPDGSSPATGFHFRIDPLFEKVPLDREALLASLGARDPRPTGNLWPLVLATLAESHSRIDAAYALEPALAGEAWDDPTVVAFACERYRTTARTIADLWEWSWRRSAEIELPSWRFGER